MIKSYFSFESGKYEFLKNLETKIIFSKSNECKTRIIFSIYCSIFGVSHIAHKWFEPFFGILFVFR